MAAAHSRRRLRPLRILGVVAAYAAFLVAALLVFIDLYPDRAISFSAGALSKATGRELNVSGPNELRLVSWHPRLVLEGVAFANPDWSKQKQMLEAGRFEIAVGLRRLLRGKTVIRRLRLDDAVVRLEQRADGTDNWTLWAAEAAKPDDRSEVPAIRRLDLRNSRILYTREGAPDSGTDLMIERATGTIAREVRLQGQGRYQKHPARIAIQAGSIAQLQDEDTPFPIDMDLNAGPTTASIEGHVNGALASGGLDVTMRIKGESLSELYPLIGVVLPKSPPYTLTGKLGHEGSVWSFSGFDGRMGDSDLSGDLRVNLAPTPPLMTASLRSKLLDFDDLAGLVGAPPATGAGETASREQKAEAAAVEAQGRVLPDAPIDVPRLHAMDIDARLVATHVDAPNHLPIDRLDLHLTLKDGTLRADPASFDVANGRVELYSTLHSDRRPARVDVDLKARGLEAARILGDTPFTKETGGKLGGGVKLAMQGNSLRELAASADGTAQLAMVDARVSHLLLELMGLDLMESIGVFVQGDKPMDIRCAAFDLKSENGKVRSELAVIDTKDTNVTAEMSLNLANEMLELRVVPHPKDVSFLSLRQDLIVEGRLADLDFYPDPLKRGPVKGAMQKINFVLAPIVGLLTPFDLAAQRQHDDNGCEAFLRGQPAASQGERAPVRDKRLLPSVKLPAASTAGAPAKAATVKQARRPAAAVARDKAEPRRRSIASMIAERRKN